MALYDLSQGTTASGLNRLFARIANDIWEWRDECAARDALGKLTDRELDDIGLTRCDLDQMTSAARRDR